MTVQCAWCNRLKDTAGQYTIASSQKIMTDHAGEVSHGVCEHCLAVLLASPQL